MQDNAPTHLTAHLPMGKEAKRISTLRQLSLKTHLPEKRETFTRLNKSVASLTAPGAALPLVGKFLRVLRYGPESPGQRSWYVFARRYQSGARTCRT